MSFPTCSVIQIIKHPKKDWIPAGVYPVLDTGPERQPNEWFIRELSSFNDSLPSPKELPADPPQIWLIELCVSRQVRIERVIKRE